jgi:hypothetical protein
MDMGNGRSDTTTSSGYAGDLDYSDREKLAEALAAQVGIRQPKTIVTPGEALIQIGEENKRKLEVEIGKLPPFTLAAQLFREKVKSEDAKDFEGIPIPQISMIVKGGRPLLTTNAEGKGAGLGYTDTGFSQLLDYVKPASVRGGVKGTLLAITDPALRASVFNHFSTRSIDRTKGNKVTIRTYVPNAEAGLRAARAIITGTHSATTGDDLAVVGAMESAMGDALSRAKMRLTRDERRTHFEVLWPAMERQVVVGDIVLIGVRITNSETKQGALRVEPFILRTLCYNFTTAYSKGGEEEVIIRHVGDLSTKLPKVFTDCLQKVEPFVRAFGDAYKVALPGNKTRAEMLEQVAKAFELPSNLIVRANEMWDADGEKSAGETLAGLVNAMTRASQEQTMDAAIETERVAGKLVAGGWDAIAEA